MTQQDVDEGFVVVDLEPSTNGTHDPGEATIPALPIEPPMESPIEPPIDEEPEDRYGPPAVSEDLSRGSGPGQVEVWSGSQLAEVARRSVVVVAIAAAVGLAAGLVLSSGEVVRRELVYTLDESVPDGFLREDRRLLTQLVTIESDAVLGPVAEQHGMSIDEVRDRVEVETVELSEVIRLDVEADDVTTARSISDAVVDQYLAVTTASAPADDNQALLARRDETSAELEAAERELGSSRVGGAEDARLSTVEESLERQIELASLQIDRLQASLDDSLVEPALASQRPVLQAELATAEAELTALEEELTQVRVERVEPADGAPTEQSVIRRIDRLEADLATIDEELAARNLGPLVATPIRELGAPMVVERSIVAAGARGLAIGALLGLPAAVLAALVVRRRQLWRS